MQNNNQIQDQSGNSYNHLLQDGFIVAWWSAGITSAVACKMALEMYENVISLGEVGKNKPENLT